LSICSGCRVEKVLGPGQPPRLARVRTNAARPPITSLPARSLFPSRRFVVRLRSAHRRARTAGKPGGTDADVGRAPDVRRPREFMIARIGRNARMSYHDGAATAVSKIRIVFDHERDETHESGDGCAASRSPGRQAGTSRRFMGTTQGAPRSVTTRAVESKRASFSRLTIPFVFFVLFVVETLPVFPDAGLIDGRCPFF
jgi:hypothetical protein